MAHKGIREFNGEEASNIFLGQTGFDVSTGTIEAGVTSGKESVSYWVAFKAVDGAAEVQADVFSGAPGQSFSANGAAGGTALTLADGDIVYGAFQKIVVSSGTVIAYRGR